MLALSQRGTRKSKPGPSDQVGCTAGLDVHYEKINLPANQKGYDTFETTVGKLSQGESKSALTIFVKFIFDLFFQNNVLNIVQRK